MIRIRLNGFLMFVSKVLVVEVLVKLSLCVCCDSVMMLIFFVVKVLEKVVLMLFEVFMIKVCFMFLI